MKCTNCGHEIYGKFCTNCGAPAPINNDAQSLSQDQPPETTPQTQINGADTAFANQYFNPNKQSYDNNQPSVNQTSFGQQFTNPQSNYQNQQFTNQTQINQARNSKTTAIVISIISGIVIIIGIVAAIIVCLFFLDKASNYSTTDKSFSINTEPSFGIIDDDNILFDEKTHFYYKKSDDYDGLVITGFDYDHSNNSETITIEIPEKIENSNVVEIEELYSYYHDAHVTVVIPGTVKVIRSYAMSFDDYIDEVIIKEGVEIIEPNAFIGDVSLKKVTVPASVKQMNNCGIGYEMNDKLDNVLIDDFILYGKKDSAAEKYAKNGGLKFIAQ